MASVRCLADRRVALRLDALEQIPVPGLEVVHPPLYLENVTANFAHAERSRPAIVAVHDRLHGNLDPVIRALAARQQGRGNRVVAVGKDVRFHMDLIAHRPLHRKPAAIDRRRDSFNHDALASIVLGQRHSRSISSPAGSNRSKIQVNSAQVIALKNTGFSLEGYGLQPVHGMLQNQCGLQPPRECRVRPKRPSRSPRPIFNLANRVSAAQLIPRKDESSGAQSRSN
jgi:hypothetical protein